MYSKLFIGLEEARKVAEAAIAKASENPEKPMSVAVVDPYGDLIYFVKQDRATPSTVRMAIGKARSAVAYRMDTKDVRDNMKKWGRQISDFLDPNWTPVPGGICLRTPDGTLLGAIGTSGRRPGDKLRDQDIAEVGASALSIELAG